MLGIYSIKCTSYRHRFNFWLGCCLRFIESLLEVLSFGYLTVDWSMRWTRYYLQTKKIDHSWIFRYISRGKEK